jgi:hypothetical protein
MSAFTIAPHTFELAEDTEDWPDVAAPGNSEFSPLVPAFAPSLDPGARNAVIRDLQDIATVTANDVKVPTAIKTFRFDFHELFIRIFESPSWIMTIEQRESGNHQAQTPDQLSD